MGSPDVARNGRNRTVTRSAAMSTLCKWLQLLFSVSAEPKAPNEEAFINQIPPMKQLLTKKPLLTKKLVPFV